MTRDLTRAVGEFAELHEDLHAVARHVLKASTPGTIQDWDPIVSSGWTGLDVATEFDGAGATFAEVAVVLREMGRALTHSPYASVTAAANALTACPAGAARDDLLRGIVAGTALPVVALPGAGSTAAREARCGERIGAVAFTLERNGDRTRITGTAEFLADADAATTLLLPARDPAHPDATVLMVVRPDTPGITVTARPCLDDTRGFGDVVADGVVDPGSVWEWGSGVFDPVEVLLRRQALCTAIDSLGLAEAALAETVSYVSTREQFGRPVGSFQAVKHACADMLVRLRVAGQLVDAAVAADVGGDPAAWSAIAHAKSYTCDAAVDIAGKAIQLHGGMGYTWESGVHRYLERAALNRTLHGSPAEHRAAVARRYRDPDFLP
ncbi:acyl-CoA dehydrogenase family protein [Nocardia vermiculata]|uniref:Acyl-CoA/acyl-ACP dehydrogenase n=1 Tax=Nocardia vermiculata TaxID=257274 RepID=A0A846XWA4_9NOCA|nr:acyl-CoA dehydrogenase family protein [Nocardia vermiculata]NKY50917.1 acyl-CoA/acyl-ACP dehydrogenase [Nocardia vermiculata]